MKLSELKEYAEEVKFWENYKGTKTPRPFKASHVLQLIERIEKLSEAIQIITSNTRLSLIDDKEAEFNLKCALETIELYGADAELK